MKFRITKLLATVCMVMTANVVVAQEGIDDPQRLPFYKTMKDKKVVFLPLSMGFDLTETWAAMMKKQADALNYTLDIRDPNWSTDAGAQALTQIISEKPDLIVAHNPDVQVYARLLKRAQKAGIPVLQINMKSAFATEGFVGPDWIALGEKQAEVVIAKCSTSKGGSGKIAITQGPLTAAASAYQMRGVANVLAKNPDIKVVSNQAADWDATKARTVTATAIQQNPELCGVIGFWDGMDVGTGAAIKEAGKTDDIYLVTSGAGASTACDNLKSKVFDAYVSYDAKNQGRDLNTLISHVFQSGVEAGKIKVSIFSPLTTIDQNSMRADSCYKLDDLR